MIRTIKSYFIALKAGSKLGRASRFRNEDQKSEALAVALNGLNILCIPVVKRNNPVVKTIIIKLTILVEELSAELQQPGASINDLIDTLEAIKQLPAKFPTLKAWVPYLEAKVEKVSKTPLGHPSTGSG